MKGIGLANIDQAIPVGILIGIGQTICIGVRNW